MRRIRRPNAWASLQSSHLCSTLARQGTLSEAPSELTPESQRSGTYDETEEDWDKLDEEHWDDDEKESSLADLCKQLWISELGPWAAPAGQGPQ